MAHVNILLAIFEINAAQITRGCHIARPHKIDSRALSRVPVCTVEYGPAPFSPKLSPKLSPPFVHRCFFSRWLCQPPLVGKGEKLGAGGSATPPDENNNQVKLGLGSSQIWC